MDEPLSRRAPFALLVVAALTPIVLALTAPSAIAQSAGDRQYADPLAGDGGDRGAQAPAPQGGDAPTSSDDPAPDAPATGAPLPDGAEPAQSTPSESLPRTGADALALAAIGLALLAAGLAVRRAPAAASARP